MEQEQAPINTDASEGKPCKNFSRYKGVRKPTCGCTPCAAKYASAQHAKTLALASRTVAANEKVIPRTPKHIILGAKRIKVRVGSRDLENDRFAHYDYEKNEIVLHPKIGQDDRGDSVLHEFVHASLAIRGVDLPSKQEERVAMVLGTDFHELVMRNRALIEWIWKECPE